MAEKTLLEKIQSLIWYDSINKLRDILSQLYALASQAFSDAHIDGNQYVRKDASWVQNSSSSINKEFYAIPNDVPWTFSPSDITKRLYTETEGVFILDGSIPFPDQCEISFFAALGTLTLTITNGTTIFYGGSPLSDTIIILPPYSKGILKRVSKIDNSWVLTYQLGA